MLIALFTCLPLFVFLPCRWRVIEKHVVQLDLFLLLMFSPYQVPHSTGRLSSIPSPGKENIPWSPFQQEETEVSIHCNLHDLTPIPILGTGASWEMPFLSTLPTNPPTEKPSPSFYDDNHHQRHHLRLMPENDFACQWLTILRTIISLEGYCFTHQGKCHFCKVINVVYRESGVTLRSAI